MKNVGKLLTLGAVAAGAGLAGPAYAHWSTIGTGSGLASVSSLSGAIGVAASQPTAGVGTVHVDWAGGR